MKKIILLALLACVSMVSFGQAESQNYAYCELTGTGKMFSTKVKIGVDFGQKTSFWKGGAEKILKDENGKEIEFNSMVDAMNYFGAQGWEFVQAYVVSIPGMGGQQNVYHWLLKKIITKEQSDNMQKEIESN